MRSQPSVPPAVRSANIYANPRLSATGLVSTKLMMQKPVPETRIRNANADGTHRGNVYSTIH